MKTLQYTNQTIEYINQRPYKNGGIEGSIGLKLCIWKSQGTNRGNLHRGNLAPCPSKFTIYFHCDPSQPNYTLIGPKKYFYLVTDIVEQIWKNVQSSAANA